MRCIACLLLAMLLSSVPGPQALAAPPREYRVQLRYRIIAGRNERLTQYFALVRYLESVGFRKDPGEITEPEDFRHDRMTGTIAADRALLLLREPHVKSLLLMPVGYQLPEEAEQRVKVQLMLADNLPLDRQRVLTEQIRERLAPLGFQEKVGYDHRGFTRMVGTIPVSEVETLLRDLRGQPSGWLVPDQPIASLPTPIRNVSPVLVTEVLPEPEGLPAERPLPPEPPPGQDKFTADLRALLAQEGETAKPLRLEIILARAPEPDDPTWKRELTLAAPGAMIEGRLGPLVTLTTTGAQAAALAALPGVSGVRLPRSGALRAGAALDATALGRLQAVGRVAKGVLIAIVDSDFHGAAALIGKQLPARSRILDLTSECSPALDPAATQTKGAGNGTLLALATAKVAPDAELILIRVDPLAPYQLLTIARALNAEPIRTECLDQRRDELVAEGDRLQVLRRELLSERNLVLSSFGQDDESRQKRQAYQDKQSELEREEKSYQQRLDRFLQLQRDLQRLRIARAVVCGLVWNEGYPVGGSSPLSRYLDDYPLRAAIWLQATGDTNGQAWSGWFRDYDGNGVLEFAPPETRLRPGRWTSELNFLGWQPHQGPALAELPAKATVRLSVQWREAHDPALWRSPDDLYRQPIAPLRVVVLRQRDPSGVKLPVDDLEVVAVSSGLPQRLLNTPGAATYEQSLNFRVEQPGVYALRIEGRPPSSIRPANLPMPAGMPAISWELWPRVFVDATDAVARSVGRPIFLDYSTVESGLGMPADAHSVVRFGGSAGPERPHP